MPEQTLREARPRKPRPLELACRLETGVIGLLVGQERSVVLHAEAACQLLVGALPRLPMAFELEAGQIEPLHGVEVSPHGAFDAARHSEVCCNDHGSVDDLLELALFIARPAAEQLVLDVHALDLRIPGEDPEGSGIGSELIVGVSELRAVDVIDTLHEVDLRSDFVVHFGIQLVEPGGFLHKALAEHQKHGTLDVVPFFEAARCLCPDGPCRGDAESGRPEDHTEIRPDAGILVSKHDELEALVRHVEGKVGVDVHHALLEVFVSATHSKGSVGVRVPIREELGKLLFVPCKEEVCKLVVVHRISVRRVSYPKVGCVGDVASVYWSLHLLRD